MVTWFSRRKGLIEIILAAAKIQIRVSPVLLVFPQYGTDSSITWTKHMHFYCPWICEIALAKVQTTYNDHNSINILVDTEGSLVLKFTGRFDDYIVTTSVVRGLDER
jgi:hypothetical protein